MFFGAWIGALLQQWGLLSLDGSVPIGLRPYFGVAGACGWLSGNVYIHRRRHFASRAARRVLLLLYTVGPPGLIYLLWGMAPLAMQRAAPLVPLIGLAVFFVFFSVPIVFGGGWSQPPTSSES